MRPRRLATACAGATLLIAAATWSQPADPCADDYAAAQATILELNRQGEAAHGEMLRTIRRLKERHADGPPACVAAIMTEEIALTNFLDDYPEAIRLSTEFLATPFADDFPDERIFTLRVRGYAFETLGRTVDSAQDYFEAATMARRVTVLQGFQALIDAAQTAMEIGDLDAAARYHDEGRALLTDTIAVRTDIAECLRLRLGRLYNAQATLDERRLRATSRPEERLAVARQMRTSADSAAVLIRAECGASLDPRMELAFEAMAHSAAALAGAILDGPGTTQASLDQAQRRLAESDGVHPEAGHLVWMRTAQVHRLAGDPVAARRAVERARAEGQRAGSVANEAEALEALADLAEADGQLDRAEGLYRDALALREVQRERLELQDWSVTAFAASQAPYRGLTRLLVAQGRVEEAFRMLDRSRARHLQDLRAQVRLRERLQPEQRLRADSVLTAIEEARLARLRAPNGPAGREAALQISRLQTELTRITAAFERKEEAPLDLAALQRTLGQQNRTLVSYFLNETASVAFVVTPESITAHSLGTTPEAVEALMTDAAGPWGGRADPGVALGPLHSLYQTLIAPVADVLPDGSGLVVIPDGPLAALPFGALLEAPAERLEGAPFLIRSRAISNELAAALIVEPDASATEPLPVDLVALGRSQFDTAADGTARGGVVLSNLPFVAAEVRQIASKVRNREVAINRDATEALLQGGLQRGRLVHVASHATADPVFPMHSRMYLWPTDDDDGVLHLYELQADRVLADLVVLSGCSTADGRALLGEGPLGLHYGLRAAGARATLATLWPVDDRATAFVTAAFYAALAEGLPKDRALQTAQVAYLDAHGGDEASPFFWAAAMLSGSPAPVDVDPARDLGTVPLAAGGLALGLLGLALAWRLRRRPTRA